MIPIAPSDRTALVASRMAIQEARAAIERLMSSDPTVREMATRLGEILEELVIELEVIDRRIAI